MANLYDLKKFDLNLLVILSVFINILALVRLLKRSTLPLQL
jgi:hypothetical protein